MPEVVVSVRELLLHPKRFAPGHLLFLPRGILGLGAFRRQTRADPPWLGSLKPKQRDVCWALKCAPISSTVPPICHEHLPR